MEPTLHSISDAYTKAVCIACYDYLKAYLSLNELDPIIHIIVGAEPHKTDASQGIRDHIIYNISESAVTDLYFGDVGISFVARFNGKMTPIHVPWKDLWVIYSPSLEAQTAPVLHDPFGMQMIEQLKKFSVQTKVEAVDKENPVERDDVLKKRSKIKLC